MHDRASAVRRHHLALGDLVTELVRADERFEVVATPRFGLTCFRPKVSIPASFCWGVSGNSMAFLCRAFAPSCCAGVDPS